MKRRILEWLAIGTSMVDPGWLRPDAVRVGAVERRRPTASPSRPTSAQLATGPRYGGRDGRTRSPIKHVVVIVGENRTFDHVFATYKARHGQYVDNLLSKDIINEDGSPGPNYALALQHSAVDERTKATSLSARRQEALQRPAGGARRRPDRRPISTSIADAQGRRERACPTTTTSI